MKKEFSTKWKGSRQARKQRKYLLNSPLHLRHKLLSANLSKTLRQKYSRRNFPLRKNDTVKVMRGKFKGKQGKVNSINLKKLKISIEGLQIQKKDGTKVNVYFHPSKLQVQELSLEDKKRIKRIGIKKEIKEDKKIGEKHPENRKFSGSLNSRGIQDAPKKN